MNKGLEKMYLPSLCMVFLIALILPGCAGSPSSPQQPAAPAPVASDQPAVSAQPGAWLSDGTISDNEYTRMQQIGNLQVFTRLDGDLISIAMRAKNNGYLALGIRPENKMQGADVIIGALSSSQAKITDDYATGAFGPHPADVQLGGTDDILNPSGGNQNGWTVFEFRRKLSTGDSRDKDLAPGDNPVLWSIGGSADTTIHHNNRGYATLNLP